MLDASSDGYWVWHVPSGLVEFSPRFAALLGYEVPELSACLPTWERLIELEDRARVLAALHAHLRGETEQYSSEHRLRHSSGRCIWVLARGRVVERDDAGAPVRAVVTHTDVSDHVRREQALRASEELFRTVAENTPDPVVRYDCARRCRYLNPSAIALIDRPVSEVLGRTGEEMDRTVPLLSSLDRELDQVLRSREPVTVERVLPGPEGERAFECRLAPECDPRGCLWSILVVAREVTERMRHQELLRRLGTRIEEAREEEQTRIARDLHDDMGQLLTALKLRLERMEEVLDRHRACELAAALLDQTVAATELADQAQAAVRQLARNLHSPILDELGLREAIGREVRQLQQRTGLPCSLSMPGALAPLAPDRAMAAYRIVQEALTNVVRHAHARHALVAVEAVDGCLLVRVEDDGRGVRASPAPGVGITGMRERAERFGGELVVMPRAEGGTRVVARIPLHGGCR